MLFLIYMEAYMRFLFTFILFLLGAAKVALANPACAVCTVTIGATLSVARAFGVDDCVVGVWSGAMLALIGFWTIRFFDKRGWRFRGRDTFLVVLSVAMIGFMYLGEMTYSPGIIGFLYIDSFLFANIMGAIVLILANHLYQFLKERNGGHAHFPFEKVVIPVLAVALTSLAFHVLPLCNCHANDLTLL